MAVNLNSIGGIHPLAAICKLALGVFIDFGEVHISRDTHNLYPCYK